MSGVRLLTVLVDDSLSRPGVDIPIILTSMIISQAAEYFPCEGAGINGIIVSAVSPRHSKSLAGTFNFALGLKPSRLKRRLCQDKHWFSGSVYLTGGTTVSSES